MWSPDYYFAKPSRYSFRGSGGATMATQRFRSRPQRGSCNRPRDARFAWKAAVSRNADLSGGPGELGVRDPGLPLVLDPEGTDLRALGLGGVEVGRGWMARAGDPGRFPRLDSDGDDV